MYFSPIIKKVKIKSVDRVIGAQLMPHEEKTKIGPAISDFNFKAMTVFHK